MAAQHTIDEVGRRARDASRVLAGLGPQRKQTLLEAMAIAVDDARVVILDANAGDMEQGEREGVGPALLDRLLLTDARIDGIVGGLRKVALLPDPVGDVTDGWTMYNGIRVKRVRVPLGVVAVIYEARPNVTADAGGLCVKSGNAAILRGSSYALRSNLAVASAMRSALETQGLPVDAIQVLEDTTRDGARALMQARQWVDLLVPRGGPNLIKTIEEEARVPFVIDGAGNCHVYVDAAADLDAAHAITFNAKVQRPGVCNAAETLLVHEAVASKFLPQMARSLMEAGVELRGDTTSREIVEGMAAATDDDWATEFHDMIMAVRVVPDLDAAIDHIRRFGTGHTESIVSEDYTATERFIAGVDAAVTMVNASTRFTDGEEFGFGAEIGISTQKLHVRGPMGLKELTCERYILHGDGHVR